MLRAGSTGFGHLGLIEVERAHAAGVVRRTQSHLLPSTIKLVLLVNAYLDERYQGVPLARAHNQRLALRHALDEALGRYDLLLAPTVTRVAVALPTARLTPVEAMSRIVSETTQSAPANVTGHPALAVPSGLDPDGLPTSAQLIGPRYGERRAWPPGPRSSRSWTSADPRLMHIGVNLNNREALIAPDYGVPSCSSSVPARRSSGSTRFGSETACSRSLATSR